MSWLTACLLLFTIGYLFGRQNTQINTVTIEVPTVFATPSTTQTQTPMLSSTATPTPTQKFQVQGAISPSNKLLETINSYRTKNEKAPLALSHSLCTIASERVAYQVKRGELDHTGFDAYLPAQQEFNSMGEIIQYNSKAVDEKYIVNSGWANSSRHNSSMLKTDWTHGCGKTSGNFAVFIFGRK